MSVKIIVKGQDVFVNRVLIPRNTLKVINFMARNIYGLYIPLAQNRTSKNAGVVNKFFTEEVPHLEPEEVEALWIAVNASLRGYQDHFECNNSLMNALALGHRIGQVLN